jgi:hypothetical protein
MTLKRGNMEDYKSKMGFCGIAIDRLLFSIDSYMQADQPILPLHYTQQLHAILSP